LITAATGINAASLYTYDTTITVAVNRGTDTVNP
jgi:hypothetical protein